MERYEEPSDDVLAWFSAHGVVLDQEQRYQIAKLEVIEGSEGLMRIWTGLSGGIEERIQAVNAVQERRALEGWRLETDYRADREAEERADAKRRQARAEQKEIARKEKAKEKASSQAAQEKRRIAFERAKGRLAKQWGKGAWTTLEADLREITWGDRLLRLQVGQVNTATAKKAVFLSAAMEEFLGEDFQVEIVSEVTMTTKTSASERLLS